MLLMIEKQHQRLKVPRLAHTLTMNRVFPIKARPMVTNIAHCYPDKTRVS